ncbi:hypothetical protein F2Q70_00041064 [Brassica cretica]|uniref:Uncharacterized protein n=1 Tax=Brassica cretica TaxID=69181 RepID=A0A8S9K7I5_BRACR|nr:hypothetical protein F2Q70_00041064 [Brassica cretica]
MLFSSLLLCFPFLSCVVMSTVFLALNYGGAVFSGQDGAQLDPTEVSPSDDATMVESEANME